jgi:hypothetical protein
MENYKYTVVMTMVFGGMNPMKNTSSPLPDVKLVCFVYT